MSATTAAIPVWVYAVFALLVLLGYRQSRDRDVSPMLMIGLAVAMAAWSAFGVVSGLGASALVLLAWAKGMTLSATVGRRWLAPRDITFDSNTGRVSVPGSWIPLALMMTIFVTKFGLGVAAGIGAPMTAAHGLAPLVALVLGLASGGFTARAIAVMQVMRAAKGEPGIGAMAVAAR